LAFSARNVANFQYRGSYEPAVLLPAGETRRIAFPFLNFKQKPQIDITVPEH
jgi:hypothetical protein